MKNFNVCCSRENQMRKIRSYVTRKKRLTNLQQRALDQYAEHYCIPYDPSGSSELKRFIDSGPCFLEIGFGMGEVTAQIAESCPENRYLGVEVYQPGVGKLLHEIHTRKLENLRIVSHDVTEVLYHMVEDCSLEGVHLFFPDPWPKKRHHKRRLIQPRFVSELTRVLKPGGYIYAVTDWEDYAYQMLEVFSSSDLLGNCSSDSQFIDSVSWRPVTKFERKGTEKDHVIRELMFRKD